MVDVLAVGAHPDDVEMCCGGLLATLTDAGRSLVIADLTRGEMGTRGTPDERAREAAAAAKVLGAEQRDNLDLGDGRLAVDERRLDAVIELLRRHRPRLVIAPLLHDLHPDHQVAGQLVKQASYLAGVRKLGPDLPPHRPELLLHYFMHESEPPSFIADVSAAHDRKVAAIRCFASQLHDPSRAEPETMISAPSFLDNLIARDRYHGSRIGVRHGEAYFVERPLAVTDVFHLLRDQP